jgi:hypothetical protein
MLKTDNGWQLIGVQSSAPAAKDRWRADNRALSVTGFRDSWKRWLRVSQRGLKRGNGLSGEFYHDHTGQQQYQSYPAFVI